MRKGKKMRRNLTIAIVIMFIALGFAFLSTKLDISGFYGIKSMKWKIYWKNVVVNENSVVAPAPTLNTDSTKVTYQITLDEPTDFYEFTVDAVNDGTMDAIVSTVERSAYDSTGTNKVDIPAYLEYKVTNVSDDTELAIGQELPRKSTKKYKVRVSIKSGLSFDELPSTNSSIRLVFSVEYSQKKNHSKESLAYYDGEASTEEVIPDLYEYSNMNTSNKTVSIIGFNMNYVVNDNFRLSDCNNQNYGYNENDNSEYCSPRYFNIPDLNRIVVPAKVTLDSNGKYDPNGEEYTVTSFDLTGDLSGYIGRLNEIKELILPNTVEHVALVDTNNPFMYLSLEKLKLSNKLDELPLILISIHQREDYGSIIIPSIKIPKTVTTIFKPDFSGGSALSGYYTSRHFQISYNDDYTDDSSNKDYGYELYIPSSVTEIEEDAIEYVDIKRIYVENETVKKLVMDSMSDYCDMIYEYSMSCSTGCTYYVTSYSCDDDDYDVCNLQGFKESMYSKIIVDSGKF